MNQKRNVLNFVKCTFNVISKKEFFSEKITRN